MSIEPQQLPADCRRARDILARVGDKWTILLLMVLGDRRMRFTELHRAVNGISERMLTVTLRNLEHDGILIRTVYLAIPPRVEYELSDRGVARHRGERMGGPRWPSPVSGGLGCAPSLPIAPRATS